MTPITRRSLLASAAALPLAGRAAVTQSPTLATAKLPNIVFFLADDLGYADVSCYGRPDIATPNIDRVAVDGIRFLQAMPTRLFARRHVLRSLPDAINIDCASDLKSPSLGQFPISVCQPAIPLCHHC